jgi:hypothetical protein
MDSCESVSKGAANSGVELLLEASGTTAPRVRDADTQLARRSSVLPSSCELLSAWPIKGDQGRGPNRLYFLLSG